MFRGCWVNAMSSANLAAFDALKLFSLKMLFKLLDFVVFGSFLLLLAGRTFIYRLFSHVFIVAQVKFLVKQKK
jgi:hypothetical protein